MSPVTEIRSQHPLHQWCKRQKIKIEHAVAMMGLSRAALHHWSEGRCTPSNKSALQIEEFTEGEVTTQDCFNYWKSRQHDRA